MDTVLGFDAIGFWIIATGILVNVSGALLGNYLVLRRMSLLGDAISHAVLPGLAIAFVVAQSRHPIPMLIGAALAGLATVLLTELIRRFARVAEDAAIGVVFTSLFALGVILISRVASQVDLDPGCVLYGILESAALDTISLAGLEIPRMTLTLAIATVIIIAFVGLFWKELKIVSFDPNLATTLGLPTTLIHYLLMAMVAGFTVVAFEAVGSILVVAMLVVPSATAYLLTDRMHWMVLLSVVVGISSAVLGRESALMLDTSVAGMMAVAAGAHFVLAVLFGPHYGVVARTLFQLRVKLRIQREDIMALVYRWQERGSGSAMPRNAIVEAMSGRTGHTLALNMLTWRGLMQRAADGFSLSDEGRKEAGKLIRGHRLWESFLAKHSPLPDDHLHSPADRMEHFINDKLLQDVAQAVDHPDTDPHGQPILSNGKG